MYGFQLDIIANAHGVEIFGKFSHHLLIITNTYLLLLG